MSTDDLNPSGITYADLDILDAAFEDVENAATAYQHLISKPALAKRAATVSSIKGFWPLVFERAPPELDQYIQPSDSQVFASCLTGLHVDRFQCKGGSEDFAKVAAGSGSLDTSAFGEPRSLSFKFEFAENEWFTDKVLEKKFWFRRSRDGEGGLVSEPVKINWKKGKDLTNGLLDASVALFEAQKKGGLLNGSGDEESKKLLEKAKQLPEYTSLASKVEDSVEGSQSFFTWFGYRGAYISEAESVIAAKEYKESAKKAAEGKLADAKAEEDKDEPTDDDELEPAETAAEIFFDGDNLAVVIAEEIWPNALRYFREAQEVGDEDDFEDLDVEDLEAMDAEMGADEDDNMEEIRNLAKKKGRKSGEGPPAKKRKA